MTSKGSTNYDTRRSITSESTTSTTQKARYSHLTSTKTLVDIDSDASSCLKQQLVTAAANYSTYAAPTQDAAQPPRPRGGTTPSYGHSPLWPRQ